MSTPRQELISQLFHAASGRPPAERSAFLKQACEGDFSLQREVESLLHCSSGAAQFLETPVVEAATETSGDTGLIGRRIGPYDILAFLGAGGMGQVYRARDSKLARDVAIKTLPLELASEPNRLTGLRREAYALATLNHPNIAAIYGLEESAAGCYLVLELVDGETLADRISRSGPIPTAEVLRIASQMAEALEAAHEKGIAHRDIKPANVKVTPEGRVKVLDFGLAKARPVVDVSNGTSTQSTLTILQTARGGIVGTPPYMSPEQIRGQASDQQTDVWAFGCVVYELLTGQRPFRGTTIPDIIAAILQGEPDWQALPADVPENVRALLRRCLEKDADRRLQGFEDVRRELARAIAAPAGQDRIRRRIVLLSGAVPVTLAVLLAFAPSLLQHVDYAVYDTILRRSTTHLPDPRVVIVEIDDRSLAAIGQWPWRRDVLGRLVAQLRQLGASAIAIDFLLPEPDRYQERIPNGDALNPGRTATPDEVLADSLRPGTVILGYAMTFGPGAQPTNDCELHPVNIASFPSERTAHPSERPFFQANGSVCSLRMLSAAAGQSGFLNAGRDSDGVLRRAPLFIEFNGSVYPSLAFAAVSLATAPRQSALHVAHANHVSLTLDQRTVPLDGRSNLMLRYRGRKRTFPYVSAADVMGGRAVGDAIKGKIVFVGATAVGAPAVVATPLDPSFVGVEVQATIADNLLQLDSVYRPVDARTLEALAALGLGLSVTLLLATVGVSAAALAGLVGAAVLWISSVWLLSTSGAFLSPLYATVGVVLAFVSMTLAKVGLERRRAEMAIRKVENAVLHGGRQ
jgi:serine/threonine protein kinase